MGSHYDCVGRYDNLPWMACNVERKRERGREGDRGRGRQSESQREAELKNSVSLYLLPDKLNHAQGSLQARKKAIHLLFCAAKTVWSHLAHWQLSSIDEIHFLLFSLLFTD